MTLTAKNITWETFEGETQGFYDGEHGDFQIDITARVNRTRWNMGTNERTWTVEFYGGDRIAAGQAIDLREAKRAALAALNAHLYLKAQT